MAALLHELFGPHSCRPDTRTFVVGSKTIEVSVIASAVHVELSPADVGRPAIIQV